MFSIDPKLLSNPIDILISYDEVIRDPNIQLIHKLIQTHKKYVIDWMDIDRVKSLSPERLAKDLSVRTIKNPLIWLKNKEYSDRLCNKLYTSAYRHYKDLYIHDTHVMLGAMKKLAGEKFVNQIYIYSKDYDERKAYDIKKNFEDHNQKVTYVTGVYTDVVEKINNIRFIIDNDLDRIEPILRDKTYNKSINFMIAKYGYNYALNEFGKPIFKNDLLKYTVKEKINITEFIPVIITERSFLAG